MPLLLILNYFVWPAKGLPEGPDVSASTIQLHSLEGQFQEDTVVLISDFSASVVLT